MERVYVVIVSASVLSEMARQGLDYVVVAELEGERDEGSSGKCLFD